MNQENLYGKCLSPTRPLKGMPKPNTKYNHNIPFSYFQNIFLNERNKFWAKQLILVVFWIRMKLPS
jgi:hypothetical protein